MKNWCYGNMHLAIKTDRRESGGPVSRQQKGGRGHEVLPNNKAV
jgi:hypothetical protein